MWLQGKNSHVCLSSLSVCLCEKHFCIFVTDVNGIICRLVRRQHRNRFQEISELSTSSWGFLTRTGVKRWQKLDRRYSHSSGVRLVRPTCIGLAPQMRARWESWGWLNTLAGGQRNGAPPLLNVALFSLPGYQLDESIEGGRRIKGTQLIFHVWNHQLLDLGGYWS